MKIVFAVILALLFPIAALLFTGHAGVAEKLSIASFILLSGSVIYTLLLHDEKQH